MMKIVGWALLALGVLICIGAFQYDTSMTEIGLKPSELGISSDVGWVQRDVPSLMWRQMMGLLLGLCVSLAGFMAILAGYVVSAIQQRNPDDGAIG